MINQPGHFHHNDPSPQLLSLLQSQNTSNYLITQVLQKYLKCHPITVDRPIANSLKGDADRVGRPTATATTPGQSCTPSSSGNWLNTKSPPLALSKPTKPLLSKTKRTTSNTSSVPLTNFFKPKEKQLDHHNPENNRAKPRSADVVVISDDELDAFDNSTSGHTHSNSEATVIEESSSDDDDEFLTTPVYNPVRKPSLSSAASVKDSFQRGAPTTKVFRPQNKPLAVNRLSTENSVISLGSTLSGDEATSSPIFKTPSHVPSKSTTLRPDTTTSHPSGFLSSIIPSRGENSQPCGVQSNSSSVSIEGFRHTEPSGALLRQMKNPQVIPHLGPHARLWLKLSHHFKHKLAEDEKSKQVTAEASSREISDNTFNSRVPPIYFNGEGTGEGFPGTPPMLTSTPQGPTWSRHNPSSSNSVFSPLDNSFQGNKSSVSTQGYGSPFNEERFHTTPTVPTFSTPAGSKRSDSYRGSSPIERGESYLPPSPSAEYEHLNNIDNDVDWGPDFDCDIVENSVFSSTTPFPDHSANKSSYFQNTSSVSRLKKEQQEQSEVNDDSAEFDSTNFPHYKEMLQVFRQQFGLNQFRMKQRPALNAAMLGHDCFVLMPTGGGKSVCYQLPALLQTGLTVVISPLRSLILDQVNKLKSLDIPAACLMGDISVTESNRIINELCRPSGPGFHLLFVTPEKVVASNRLLDMLLGLFRREQLARFVIDEAHCVSQWGHDFRPDYKRLSNLRKQFPGVPMMALTATATLRVRKDILHQLCMTNTKWFVSSFDRPNLSYSVRDKNKTTMDEIAELIKKKYPRKSGIVYGFSRKECENTARALKEKGISADCYHAGLSDKQRTKVQTDWVLNKIKVVVATIAFGMGIDKPDVRFVIHFSIAKSIEGYYQEAGRAGRDGDNSTCVLYFSTSDVMKIRSMIQKSDEGNAESKKTHLENLRRMVNYCENKSDCRRAIQLQYFGENYTKRCPNNPGVACDNCLSQESYKVVDVTEQCKSLVSDVRKICNNSKWDNFTINHLADVVKGSKCRKVLDNRHEELPSYGVLAGWDKVDVCRLINRLVMDDFLSEYHVTVNDNTCSYIRFGPRAQDLINGRDKVIFTMREVEKKSSNVGSPAVRGGEESTGYPELDRIHEQCFSELMDVVTTIAEINQVNTNTIMNIQALKAMSLNLPETREEMLAIAGVTKANYEKYGRDLLKITGRYAEEKKKYDFAESKKRPLSPTLRTHGSTAKKRRNGNASETVPGSYVAPYRNRIKRKRKNNSRATTSGRGFSGFKGRGGAVGRGGRSGNTRGGGSTNQASSSGVSSYNSFGRGGRSGNTRGGGNTNQASSSGVSSYKSLQSSRPLPPSNRPGFMPIPKVTSLLKRSD